MHFLGKALRRARESRNLSIEQAERETRIRAKFLVAIENGDLSEIPSRVQARGFLYNYAQSLGLNPGDIVAQFDAIQGTGPVQGISAPNNHAYPPQTTPNQPPPYPQYSPPIPTPPPQPSPLPQAPPTPTQTAIPRLPTPPMPIPTPLPGVPAPENGTALPVEQTLFRRLLASDLFLVSILALVAVLALGIGGRALGNLPTNEPEENQSNFLENLDDSLATGTITPTFQPTSTPTATVPPLASDRVRVSFEVTQRNWMRIEVDGEPVYEGLAEPDTILQYEGAETVRVVTGNGGALEVTYNGVELGPLGQRGFVAEQIYTLGGLETLTPTPTPTMTNTPIPTATGTGGPSPTPEETQTPSDESP
jgi:hypothetical protein